MYDNLLKCKYVLIFRRHQQIVYALYLQEAHYNKLKYVYIALRFHRMYRIHLQEGHLVLLQILLFEYERQFLNQQVLLEPV
ncbi:hypothetical protein YBT1518_15405 [Bacillus thuringiensis YBT-1518]|uniref:Uncharacterized protein n=1 Tax=Bacillus thuringiensis YBT-1518 TaxID=529122 RepID=A0A9W3PGE4_BACTU|nr:hypothetical protein YBT1518_15405 [Bacillus thuringiensis YBT-1518]